MSSVTEHAESLVVGKWHYMAPEATTNEKVDHRSDMFSLGVVLYLLLSGEMPFTDREPKQIVKKIRAGQYKPLNEVAVVPDALAALVHRMLAPKPEDRPQRGQEVALTLNEIAKSSGVESSNARIAELLTDLFPDEASSPFEDAALEIQIGDGSSRSPASTPASLSRFDGPIDVSVTLHRRQSKSMSIPPVSKSGSQSAQRGAAKMPELKSSSSTLKLLIVLLIAAALAAAAYFLLPSYY
jgi:serine/threonine-protein kinase